MNGGLFKDLKYDDFIYYINPFVAIRNPGVPLEKLLAKVGHTTGSLIQGAKIKDVRGINEIGYSKWVEIEYFRPEGVLHSPDLNAIPTVILRFNGERNFALTLVALEDLGANYPVPYCTSRELLEKYIKNTF